MLVRSYFTFKDGSGMALATGWWLCSCRSQLRLCFLFVVGGGATAGRRSRQGYPTMGLSLVVRCRQETFLEGVAPAA